MDALFHLTPEALAEAKSLYTSTYPGQSLRLYIEGKGCDGFTYGVSFDSPQDGDQSFEIDGLPCLIDERTMLFCKDSEISWVDDERGRGFLVQNPREKNYRGKFYKKSTWRQKLEALNPPTA